MKLYSRWAQTAVVVLGVFSLASCGGGGGGGGGAAPAASAPVELYATDGIVNATVLSPDGNTLYIGGTFTQVGPRTGGGVPIDSTSALPVGSFPKVGGQVYASVPDGSGGWYIGGVFTVVGTVARNNLAHILANGSVDPNWNPNANSDVNTLAVAGTTVYAGGNFTVIGVTPAARNHLAALNAADGQATAWNPNANSTVNTLAVSGTTVYAGGRFTAIDNQASGAIAAIPR